MCHGGICSEHFSTWTMGQGDSNAVPLPQTPIPGLTAYERFVR